MARHKFRHSPIYFLVSLIFGQFLLLFVSCWQARIVGQLLFAWAVGYFLHFFSRMRLHAKNLERPKFKTSSLLKQKE